ncbi:MAG: QueT transporter family protein [Clostridia bacterium]|nr:QueT transporter family protein [Clostridia bacterium]
MNKFSAKVLTKTAVIAALYALCTLLFAPISYGAIQFRISESLCILSFFYPEAIFGLTIGCFIANLFGNGPLDILLGTLATLIASFLSFIVAKRIKNSLTKFIVCSLFPIIINAVLVPFTFLILTELKALYLISSLQVLFGQAVVIFTLGAFLYAIIEKSEKHLNKRI